MAGYAIRWAFPFSFFFNVPFCERYPARSGLINKQLAYRAAEQVSHSLLKLRNVHTICHTKYTNVYSHDRQPTGASDVI